MDSQGSTSFEVDIKYSDQTSLGTMWIAKDLRITQVDIKYSDQSPLGTMWPAKYQKRLEVNIKYSDQSLRRALFGNQGSKTS